MALSGGRFRLRGEECIARAGVPVNGWRRGGTLQAAGHGSILGKSRGARRTTGSLTTAFSGPSMPERPPSAMVTRLLAQARAGDEAALADVFPLVYRELHELAQRQLAREADGHTLSPTALLHEAYIRLIDYTRMQWTDRAHFLAVAATAMRRVLVDHARSHRSQKRGGSLNRVPLDVVNLPAEERSELLIVLDEALTRLQELDRRQAQVVECRFFAGLTEAETAEGLGVSLRTVKRDWAKARAWLYREIHGDAG
jgi:RNA polymerase sigma-70 factor, ECF subfamily